MKLLNIYLRFSLFIILIFFSAVFNLSAQYESVDLETQTIEYCKKGWNLLKEGKMDEAILNYKKAIELNPSFAQAYGDLGIIFEVKGQMEKAEEMYLKAIEAAPDYLNSYSNVALLYEKQADYAKAIFYWKKRLDLSESGDPYAEVARKRLEELMRLHPQESVPLESEYVMPSKKITETKSDNTELITQLNKLKDLNGQLKAKVAGLENLSQRAELIGKDVSKLNNTIEVKNQELITLKNENKDLQEKLVSYEGSSIKEAAKLKELNNQVESLDQNSAALNKENEALREKVKSNEESSKDAAKLKQERFVLETELTKQKELNSNLGEKAQGLEKGNKELQAKIALLEDSAKESEKLRQENSNLQTKVQDLSVKAKNAEQMNENIKDLNSKLTSASQENFVLIREKEELSLKADTYKKGKEGLEKEFIAEIKELKRSNARLETKGKELYIKALGVDQTTKNLNTVNKVVERMNKGQINLKKTNEGLERKIVLLDKTLKSEKARLYDELGTAYTKAKLFQQGIEAYEKSLSFIPNNADVHYNLGLLYKHYLDNSKKAVYHLKKYLEFNSKAPNKKEVEYLIGMLGKKQL